MIAPAVLDQVIQVAYLIATALFILSLKWLSARASVPQC